MIPEKTTNDTLEYLRINFQDKFNMDEAMVKRCLRTLQNYEDITLKFQLLESHDLFDSIDFNVVDINELVAFPFFRCTYDELLTAIQIPDILSFSDTQRHEYNKRALYWSRFIDIRPEVLPLLEKICGDQESETANDIICQLYIHSYTTVSSQSVKDICNMLLEYQDSANVLPAYMAHFWYSLFSVFSDPQYALSMISEIFEEEHVLAVFTDTPFWNEFGYARHELKIIQRKMAAQTDNILESAKIKFAQYLKN